MERKVLAIVNKLKSYVNGQTDQLDVEHTISCFLESLEIPTDNLHLSVKPIVCMREIETHYRNYHISAVILRSQGLSDNMGLYDSSPPVLVYSPTFFESPYDDPTLRIESTNYQDHLQEEY